jgi:DMSO/TMAO reductase YedYZ molybdopterin-dependent catalytic subunit
MNIRDIARLARFRPDRDMVLKDAERAIIRSPMPDLARRRFLQGGLSLGSLSLLTGCVLDSNKSINAMLQRISEFNDEAQALLFDPEKLAPTYSEAELTRPFPYNAYYPESQVRYVDGDTYRLEVTGQVANRKKWRLEELHAMPQTEQITRHICVEGWSAIGRWGGVRFSDFLAACGADTTVDYVGFKCADDYWTSIDMPTALHPQTLLALTYDGNILPPKYGFPMKLRMPTKLGYKNPKYIMAITVTDDYPGGYWEDQGYNWFGGS